MQILVDTLAFRCVYMTFSEVIDFLGLPSNLSWEEGSPFNGYPYCMYFNGIKIGYHGRKGFETYVYMSGKGCRTWEDYSTIEWESLLNSINYLQDDIHMARIDIACDDFTNTLNLDKLWKYYKKDMYASRCNYIAFVQGSEEIMYVGSPQSDKRLRIYNKKLERGFTDDSDLDGKPWYRAELQLRDNTATAALGKFFQLQSLGEVFFGVLREHIRFLKKSNDKLNSQRIEEAPWWVRFCQDSKRISLPAKVGSEYNLTKVERFCIETAGSSLKTLILAENLSANELYKRFTNNQIKLRQDQRDLINKTQEQYL